MHEQARELSWEAINQRFVGEHVCVAITRFSFPLNRLTAGFVIGHSLNRHELDLPSKDGESQFSLILALQLIESHTEDYQPIDQLLGRSLSLIPTIQTVHLLEQTQKLAAYRNQDTFSPAHLLTSLLENIIHNKSIIQYSIACQLLSQFPVNEMQQLLTTLYHINSADNQIPTPLSDIKPKPSEDLIAVLSVADKERENQGAQFLRTDHLLLGLLRHSEHQANDLDTLLFLHGLTDEGIDKIRNTIHSVPLGF